MSDVGTAESARAGTREPRVSAPTDVDEPVDETAHLLRSPADARRLLAAIERLENDPDAASAPV
ncbi:hypothetical protein KDL01_10435 [Actinospica durhamensis]|uniref:Uncharacterized protein n=1 Tax=Actinospica durhamensis TaxID=1508375 RepID=A0A941IR85_9ACTN|nr:hypothetical protein [Actinospica durhamensis]MBR7833683.1 hypothetical protein [Actinospica durhamensis]